MKCRTANRRMSPSLDGQLSTKERRELELHLAGCEDCRRQARQLGDLADGLRGLSALPVPQTLTTVLRVTASRERLLRARRASLGASLEYWSEMARLWGRNLMRPLALPFAGGLLTAIFLFTMMAPMYANHDSLALADVPTMLTEPATMTRSLYTYGKIDRDIVVDVLVDGQGRLLDYSIPPGQTWAVNPDVRRCIENTLLCTQFKPATWFGMPAEGKLRITIRRNAVNVTG